MPLVEHPGTATLGPCFCVLEGNTMREQYEYQRAVDAELASAVKTHGKLTTLGELARYAGCSPNHSRHLGPRR